jgi:hypothetical protein
MGPLILLGYFGGPFLCPYKRRSYSKALFFFWNGAKSSSDQPAICSNKARISAIPKKITVSDLQESQNKLNQEGSI